ncbi:MAG: hypothetical protein KAI83_01080 [Thiomargarita sp.]|nr:hypothetical protein [Thiomargarita sp.]
MSFSCPPYRYHFGGQPHCPPYKILMLLDSNIVIYAAEPKYDSVRH